MFRSSIFACILLLAFLLQFASPEKLYAQGGIHYVRYGETLSTIAIRHGVTVQEIARANAIYNVNNIRAGQRLVIPGRTAMQVAKPQVVVPTGPGSGNRSTQANQPVAPQQPSPHTPAPSYGCNGVALAGERTYTVRYGDTLYGVGRAFGVSAGAVQQRNSLTSTIIRVGQCLIVPASSRAAPAPDNRRDSERQGISRPLPVTPSTTPIPSAM